MTKWELSLIHISLLAFFSVRFGSAFFTLLVFHQVFILYKMIFSEILTEHNVHPEFKHDLPDADIVLEGVNPNCGDDIWLTLKTDGDTITDGAFVGDGCAI